MSSMHSLTSFMTAPEKWGGPSALLSKSIAYPAIERGDTDQPTDHPSAVRPWAPARNQTRETALAASKK